MAEKRRGLGRGLGALIPNSPKLTPEVGKGSASDLKDTASKPQQKKTPLKNSSQTKSLPSGTKLSVGQSKSKAQKLVKKTEPAAQKKDTQKDAATKETVRKSVPAGAKDQGIASRATVSSAVQQPDNSVAGVSSSDKSKPQKKESQPAQNNLPKDKTPTVLPISPLSSAAQFGTFGKGTKDVSRETSKKKSRIDMGAALRNTTTTRRPVDFFFGEEVKNHDMAEGLVPVPGAQFAVLKVSEIHPNRKQPRVDFDEHDMEELVHSVREIGVLQPIVVRPSREKDAEKYELVMGERRWRATQRAGLETIPAIIRDTQDNDLLRDALLENLHRSQLNPIEEAAAYQQLMEEFGTTQDQLAKRIGRSRPQISNTIRLLKLPALVQRRVAAGVLSAGHARALLVLTDQVQIETLAQKVVNEGLSVRAVEELVSASIGQTDKKKRKDPQPQKHHERLDYIAEAFADKLDTSVKISLGARKGKMTIEFANVDDLNRIIAALDTGIDG